MKKYILYFLLISGIIVSYPIDATFKECVENSIEYIQENPIKSTIGALLLANICKSGRNSIPVYTFKTTRKTLELLYNLCSTKSLIGVTALSALGYVIYTKAIKNDDDIFN